MSATMTNARKPIELAVDWLLRLGLGALFIFAGAAKLRDPGAFAVEIANYRFLTALAPWLAVMLPGVELGLGLALVLSPRRWRKAAALGMMLLLAVFTVAVAQVVARHIDIECGCFGGKESPVTAVTVLRDVALFAAAAFEYWVAGPVEPPAVASAP